MKKIYKSFFKLMGVVILSVSVNFMDASQSLLCDISRDVVHQHILPQFFLQNIFCLKQVSKTCNTLYGVERICPLSHEYECSTPVCVQLKQNYYRCTKALVLLAKKEHEHADKHVDKKNETERKKDELMFRHLWGYHAVVRDVDVAALLKQPTITIHDQMKAYRKNYDEDKNIRLHILKCATQAICKTGNADDVKVVLLGNSFDIFDLVKPKKDSEKCCYHLYFIFFKACQLNDEDVIKLLCGGIVDERSLEYVMDYSDTGLLTNLMYDDVLPLDVADAKGKTVIHYAAEKGNYQIIETAVNKGACINLFDKNQMTPLHYAVKNKKHDAVTQILSYEEADVRFKNKQGKTASDYVSKHKLLGWLDPEIKAMRKELKDHAAKYNVESPVEMYGYVKKSHKLIYYT